VRFAFAPVYLLESKRSCLYDKRSMDAAFSQTRMDSPAASQFRGKHVHFIGVGGTGMSGLARMLIDAGAIVSGSEPRPGPQTFELIRRGAKISRDQIGELLSDKIDLVVRTAAVPDNNGEMIAASALRLKIVKYAQMLGMVMGERFGVAVAGTHGKSTTSAMIAFALRESRLLQGHRRDRRQLPRLRRARAGRRGDHRQWQRSSRHAGAERTIYAGGVGGDGPGIYLVHARFGD
jgi:hypothetical protein